MRFLLFFISCFLFSCQASRQQPLAFSEPASVSNPSALYLTWFEDPSTTMVLRSLSQEKESDIYYQLDGEASYKKEKASSKIFANSSYYLHTVHLKGLKEGAKYYFGFQPDAMNRYFCTLPSQIEKDLRFIVGGDMYHDQKHLIEGNQQAAKQNPDFVILGGDLAYSWSKRAKKTKEEDFQRWFDWLELWNKHMRGSDGRAFPLMTVIGNHEVIGKYRQRPIQAKGFYTLFMKQQKRAYQNFDVGKDLTFILLDSDHTALVEGAQRSWLEKILHEKAEVPFCFAVYHVPAYPSYRAFTNKRSQKIRKQWVPLFEKYAINAAFEHHDHSYKRSYPLFEGKVDLKKGITYIGDGGWGSTPKTKYASSRWYLEKAQITRNFVLVDLNKQGATFKAFDAQGNVIDQFFIKART